MTHYDPQSTSITLELLDFTRLENGLFLLEALNPVSGERVSYQTQLGQVPQLSANFGLGFAARGETEAGYFSVFEPNPIIRAGEQTAKVYFHSRFTSLKLWTKIRADY